MDSYTKETENWLDLRYQKTDQEGVYIAHQPIYGFRKGPSEPNIISKYSRTYNILNSINKCQFEGFLDVGGSEGYYGNIISKLYHKKVVSSDLSYQACLRAKEIYNLEVKVADVHNLPFADNSFDLVLCSETLEHVSDYKKAISELSRVAKKYLIITVPNEGGLSHLSKINKIEHEPHGHINSLSEEVLKECFNKPLTYDFIRYKKLIPFMVLSEGPDLPKTVQKRYHPLLVKIYYLFRWISKMTNLGTIKKYIIFDHWISRKFPSQTADILALYIKNGYSLQNPVYNKEKILDFILENKVPKHYLK